MRGRAGTGAGPQGFGPSWSLLFGSMTLSVRRALLSPLHRETDKWGSEWPRDLRAHTTLSAGRNGVPSPKHDRYTKSGFTYPLQVRLTLPATWVSLPAPPTWTNLLLSTPRRPLWGRTPCQRMPQLGDLPSADLCGSPWTNNSVTSSPHSCLVGRGESGNSGSGTSFHHCPGLW